MGAEKAAALFQKCPVCLGEGQVQRGGDWVMCPAPCSRGFAEVGVTLGQAERWGAWERWLAGDPSQTCGEASAAEKYIMDRLVAWGGRTVRAMLDDALDRRAAANPPQPAFVCHNCGATAHFRGAFSAPAFERQKAAFDKAHGRCRPSIDGGGI